MTLDKLLKLLDKKCSLKKEKWNREILLAYLFFRDERVKNSELGKISENFLRLFVPQLQKELIFSLS